MPAPDGPSTATLDGLFVRGTRRGRISYDPTTFDAPLDAFGSYSAYVGPRCSMAASNVTLDGNPSAALGLVSFGEATVRRGVITRHRTCAASGNTTTAASITLDGVALLGNARDTICADDSLPSLRLPLSPD